MFIIHQILIFIVIAKIKIVLIINLKTLNSIKKYVLINSFYCLFIFSHSDTAIAEDQYSLYGIKVGPNRLPHRGNQIYDPTR